jgi:hypothetical protein
MDWPGDPEWRDDLARLLDFEQLSDEDRGRLLDRLEAREKLISARRRRLHRTIDRLRAERVRRLRALHSGGGSLHRASEELDPPWLSYTALKLLIGDLDREDDLVSLHRRVLHFWIDLLRWNDGLGGPAPPPASPDAC